MRTDIAVIGANAAGMTAASRAKRINPDLDVTLFEQSSQIAYSICGLPYWLAGQVERFEDLILFTPSSLLNERGIRATVSSRVAEIHPQQRSLIVDYRDRGESETVHYEHLLVATGYRPKKLDVDGADAAGLFTASHIQDGQAIEAWMASHQPRNAAVIGGGYVGVEMAEALHKRGLSVVLVESSSSLLPHLDPSMSGAGAAGADVEWCSARAWATLGPNRNPGSERSRRHPF